MRINNALLKATRFVSIGSSVKNALDFLEKAGEVDAWMPDEEVREETHEQQLQVGAAIQQAFEDIRRQERIMGLIEHDNGDELESR